ncbi:MAG TPA: thioredoxin family protein [Cytophagales bacterium]|jgi:peroxiredoxin|nr:thioredoxin family protein [Cytophagales bacterium]
MIIRSILLTVCFAGLVASSAFVNNGYQVGDQATDFELKNVDGKMVSLSDYKDADGYVVIFTCNSCPYAKKYEQRIIDLHNKYADKGYPVIAINPNDPEIKPEDSFDEMKRISKEKGYPFAYVYDETQEVAKAYGAKYTPHVYLLDDEMKVRYIGAIDNNYKDADAADVKYVENAIEALMNGQEVGEENTKAIGCTIKWRKG